MKKLLLVFTLLFVSQNVACSASNINSRPSLAQSKNSIKRFISQINTPTKIALGSTALLGYIYALRTSGPEMKKHLITLAVTGLSNRIKNYIVKKFIPLQKVKILDHEKSFIKMIRRPTEYGLWMMQYWFLNQTINTIHSPVAAGLYLRYTFETLIASTVLYGLVRKYINKNYPTEISNERFYKFLDNLPQEEQDNIYLGAFLSEDYSDPVVSTIISTLTQNQLAQYNKNRLAQQGIHSLSMFYKYLDNKNTENTLSLDELIPWRNMHNKFLTLQSK